MSRYFHLVVAAAQSAASTRAVCCRLIRDVELLTTRMEQHGWSNVDRDTSS